MPRNELHNIVVQKGRDQEFQRDLSVKDLDAFVREHCPRYGDEAADRLERRQKFHRDVLPDPDKLALYAFLCQTRAKTDALLNSELEDLTAEEKFARINAYHEYTDLGSAILYEHNDYRGSAKFLTIPWPNLGWKPYKFNDKASSGRAWGINIFFKGSWYRTEGQNPLWLIGIPYIEFPDFNRFGYNDIISSYLP